MFRSRWFRRAVADGGLVLRGRRWFRSADLRLSPEAAEVRARGETLRLEWDDFRHQEFPLSGEAVDAPADGWWISPWTAGELGPSGVAVGLGAGYVARATRVRKAARGWRVHLDTSSSRRRLIPLWPIDVVSLGAENDRRAVEVVASLAASRPSVRERLSDEDRVRRLIDDMRDMRWAIEPFRMGGRRRVVEVLTTMRLLGYEHRFGGRPLPGEPLPTADEVVETVLAKVHDSPYTSGLSFDERFVRDVVERHYLSVEPWPVAALLD